MVLLAEAGACTGIEDVYWASDLQIDTVTTVRRPFTVDTDNESPSVSLIVEVNMEERIGPEFLNHDHFGGESVIGKLEMLWANAERNLFELQSIDVGEDCVWQLH